MTVFFSLGDLLLLPFLIGYTAWWSYDLWKGARVRRWTLALHIVVYSLAGFWAWDVSLTEIADAGGTLAVNVLWFFLTWFFVLPVLFYLITRAGLRYGRRRVVVFGYDARTWRYRGPIAIAVFWLVLYVFRYVLEDAVLGGFSVLFPVPLPHGAPPNGLSLLVFGPVVVVVACLYLLSFGFLLGISLSVWGLHRRAIKATGTGDPSATGARRVPPRSALGAASGSVPERPPSSVPGAYSTTATTGDALSVPPNRSLRGARGSMPPGEMPARTTASRYCVRCGSRYEREGRFCVGCGAPRSS